MFNITDQLLCAIIRDYECSDDMIEHIIDTGRMYDIQICYYLKFRSHIGKITDTQFYHCIKYIIDSGKLADTYTHHDLRRLVASIEYPVEIAKHIISKIDDINKVIYDGGLNLLHVCDNLDILKYIEDNTDIDPHHLADDQKSTLYFLNTRGELELRGLDTIKFLIEEMKVDPLIRDMDGNTLLHFSQDLNALEYLRKYIDINAINKYGMTHLHCRIKRNITENTVMVTEGANLNAIDNNGMTPLHYAISSPKYHKLFSRS